MSLLLALPAAVGLWLVSGGRALPVRPARVLAAGTAVATLGLAVAVVVTGA
ncbi:MAG: hypothetical protein IE926_11280, partial [Micrococcales bacterium]|nr:hypothetical protein [Micrococcales bacterium]